MAARDHLPIDLKRNEILDLVWNNTIVIISSPTGSGKTTKIPQFIYDKFTRSKIIITQPRRIAAVRAAERIAQERNTRVGGNMVGYRIQGDCKVQVNTAMTYATTGTLMEMLTNSHKFLPYTHVILDEVHNRDIFTDVVLLQLKLVYLNQDSNWSPKLILLSATIDPSEFSQYFEGMRVGQLKLPDNNRLYPLNCIFNDDLENGSYGITVPNLVNPDVDRPEAPTNFNQISVLVSQLHMLETPGTAPGAVLIFLPGVCEIQLVRESLESHVLINHSQWVIAELYSNLTKEEMRPAFENVGPNQRKIILSTNIAESSVTIPDVVYVIDLCLVRTMVYDSSVSCSRLNTLVSSKSQSVQRAGRAGRVSIGYCFHLVWNEFWEHKMKKSPLAEMQNCGLDMVVLYFKHLNMGTASSILLQAINPPTIDSIRASILSLKEKGALTILDRDNLHNEEDGEVTVIGELAILTGVDPKLARLIFFGRIFNMINEAITIAAALSSKPLFCTFDSRRWASAANVLLSKIDVVDKIQSDAMSYIEAYNLFLHSRKTLPGNQWLLVMRENNIKASVMKEIEYTVHRILKKLTFVWGMNLPLHQYRAKQFATDNNLLMNFQTMMACASFPSIFIHYEQQQDQRDKYIKSIIGESQDQKMAVGLKLEKNVPVKDPTNQQLVEVAQAMNFDGVVLPKIRFDSISSSLVAHYQCHPHKEYIRTFPKDMYLALKFRNCGKKFNWTHNAGKHPYSVFLIGPRTPLELCVKSFIESVYDRQVFMDRDSINQILLDEFHPRPTSYYVASMQHSIATRKGQYHIVAKESTMLQSNNGLGTLLPLLVGQRVQLKMDLQQQNIYSHSISGLGVKQGTTTPIHRSRDSYIEFDVTINHADIKEANKIRQTLSDVVKVVQIFKTNDNNTNKMISELARDIIGFLNRARDNRLTDTFKKYVHWKADSASYSHDEMFPIINE